MSVVLGIMRDMPIVEGRSTGPVLRWEGDAAWFFLAISPELSDEIRGRTEHVAFGSVRVEASIGATRWRTSLFPDAKSGCYLLPVKAAVRRAERIEDGDVVTAHLVVEG